MKCIVCEKQIDQCGGIHDSVTRNAYLARVAAAAVAEVQTKVEEVLVKEEPKVEDAAVVSEPVVEAPVSEVQHELVETETRKKRK